MSSMAAELAETPRILHLSHVVGGALRDSDGQRLGKVDDLIVRLSGSGYPPITGLLVTVAGRQAYLPSERLADLAPGEAVLSKAKLDLRPFERRPEEVLLKHDVLDHQLINVEGARLVRANEVELARLEGWWRVVGVDTGPRGGLRRLLPQPLGRRIATGEFLDWASVEPFAGDVASVRLRVLHPKLAKLHPAQIADLVEAASHSEGEEIIQAVGQDDLRARGRRLRGARRAAPDGVHRAALRRGGGRGDRADGARRRRRPGRRAGRRSAAGSCSICCRRSISARCGRCSAMTRPRPAA